MAEATAEEAEAAAPRRGGAKGLLIGLVLALVLAGGGVYATWSGLLALPLPGGADDGARKTAPPPPPIGDIAFVRLDPLTVTVGRGPESRLLRLSATVEVEAAGEDHLRGLMPRVMDVLTTYLQALRTEDLDRPAVMARMRVHLLRRIRIVVGDGVARDLLITEFVLQ
jgi:flagellar FliL protein